MEAAVAAGILLVLAVVLDRLFLFATNRALARAAASAPGRPNQSAITRVRVARRLVRVLIYVIATAAALSHFPALRAFSAGLWASAGVAGLVVGMAARGTLGNAIAGVTLAFSQPFRVGDLVTCRSETGTVEDITLVFTFIRTLDGRRLVIPNDILSAEILYNHSIGDPRIASTVRFFVSPQADAAAALAALTEAARACPDALPDPAPSAAIAETGPFAVRIEVSAWAKNQSSAWALQADLKRRGLAALVRQGATPRPYPVAG